MTKTSVQYLNSLVMSTKQYRKYACSKIASVFQKDGYAFMISDESVTFISLVIRLLQQHNSVVFINIFQLVTR